VLEIKNANDGAIRPKRSLTITSTYVTDGWTDIRTKWTRDDSKDRAITRLKPHQIALCAAAPPQIYTLSYLLQHCPVDSNSKL